ncbi:MAG: PBECR4 domain-containing protein [Candidatus Limiplasma sp.]|nr:PBECR4 domain-containing protein [Candidatus Limiplasma sp.]
MVQSLQDIQILYEKSLCDCDFVYQLDNGRSLHIRFFRENLCHLLGLQHVYQQDRHYLGAAGYKRIKDERITLASLKAHNRKQYDFIKPRIEHFHEIENILRNGSLYRFYPERCTPQTRINAEFMLIDPKESYMLHLFVRSEANESIFTPISFLVKFAGDKDYQQFLTRQEHRKILFFACNTISNL